MNFKVLAFFLLSSVFCFSQKLPKVQQGSMRAPSDIVVDGVDKEWNNTFRAFNAKMNVFYTIANDDANLYLILKIKDRRAIHKALFGGIELMVSDKASFPAVGAVSFTYPSYTSSYSPWDLSFGDFPSNNSDVVKYKFQVDSFHVAVNKQLSNRIKLIGLKDGRLPLDTAVSIYNSHPVTIKSKFDRELAYFVEFAIPRASLPETDKIHYKIILSGASANKAKVDIDDTRRRIFVTGKNVPNTSLPLNDEYLDFSFPTYFSGIYSYIR
ncbi:MAG: hypothetical protein V4687_02855 [Bacteroidota bacterium]